MNVYATIPGLGIEVTDIFIICFAVACILLGLILLRLNYLRQIRVSLYMDIESALYNKNGFVKYLERTKSQYKDSTLMIVYLRNLKYLYEITRDKSGLMQEIGQILFDTLQPGEMVARLDQTHFIMVLKTNDRQEIIKQAQLIETRMLEAELEGYGQYLFDIWFSVYINFDTTNIRRSINRAFLPLIYGKPINRIYYYEDEIGRIEARLEKMDQEKEDALTNGLLKGFIQAKIDIETGEIVGGEMLSRWLDSNQEIMYQPDEYIRLFEQSDFITKLDMCMLEEICKIQQTWASSGRKVLPLSFNFSVANFKNIKYQQLITEVLSRYGANASNIEIEIAERGLFEDLTIVNQGIMQLKSMGFKIAMDDFGQEQSSLSSLLNNPFNTIKIHRQFVQNHLSSEKEKLMIENLIRLIKQIGSNVIVVGVENEMCLKNLCEIENQIVIQGFCCHRPVLASRFDSILGTTFTVYPKLTKEVLTAAPVVNENVVNVTKHYTEIHEEEIRRKKIYDEEDELRRKRLLEETEEEARRRRMQLDDEEETRRRKMQLEEEAEAKRKKLQLEEEEAEARRKKRQLEEEEEQQKRRRQLFEEEEQRRKLIEEEKRRKQLLEEEAEKRRKQLLEEEEERRRRIQQEEDDARRRRLQLEEEAEERRRRIQLEEENARKELEAKKRQLEEEAEQQRRNKLLEEEERRRRIQQEEDDARRRRLLEEEEEIRRKRLHQDDDGGEKRRKLQLEEENAKKELEAKKRQLEEEAEQQRRKKLLEEEELIRKRKLAEEEEEQRRKKRLLEEEEEQRRKKRRELEEEEHRILLQRQRELANASVKENSNNNVPPQNPYGYPPYGYPPQQPPYGYQAPYSPYQQYQQQPQQQQPQQNPQVVYVQPQQPQQTQQQQNSAPLSDATNEMLKKIILQNEENQRKIDESQRKMDMVKEEIKSDIKNDLVNNLLNELQEVKDDIKSNTPTQQIVYKTVTNPNTNSNELDLDLSSLEGLDDDNASDTEEEAKPKYTMKEIQEIVADLKKKYPNNWQEKAKLELKEKFDDLIESLNIHNDLKRSFAERMVNANADNQKIYNIIKNEVLKYAGISNATNKSADFFLIGKQVIGKMKITRSTLKLYLRLNPSDYPQGQYKQKDCSKVKVHQQTPMMVKTKSSLAVKRALVLINDLMVINKCDSDPDYKIKNYVKELAKNINTEGDK